MTLVVAIDTSGPATGIGLGTALEPGFVVYAQGGRKHAEVIDRLMHDVSDQLEGKRPDAVAVGVGPGPYSGLRVGIAFAIGLGRAWRCPVVGACSLDAIAWAAIEAGTVSSEFVVTTDARRAEVYWAKYDATAVRIAGPRIAARDDMDFDAPLVGDQQVDPAVLASRVAACLDAGDTPAVTTREWAPHGADGSEVRVPVGPLLEPRPLYLRAPDITTTSASASSTSKDRSR